MFFFGRENSQKKKAKKHSLKINDGQLLWASKLWMRMRMRLRIEEISVRVCVCGETFASNCSILSSACSELGMCANSLSSASRVFFSLSFLRLFCQQSIWTIDVAISCAALQTTSSPVPCPLSPVPVVCPVPVPDQVQNVKFLPLL